MPRDPPSRSELALEARALRQDWPVPEETKARILDRILSYLDTTTDEGATAPDRTVLAAARVLAAFCGLSLRQAELDLKRELASAGKSDERDVWGRVVAELKRRQAERDQADGGHDP